MNIYVHRKVSLKEYFVLGEIDRDVYIKEQGQSMCVCMKIVVCSLLKSRNVCEN